MENTIPKDHLKKIVIIGGGFAGLNLAKNLAKHNYYHVVLVDRNNYNYFTPLVYQVATSFLEPSNISYPFRKLFRKNDIIKFHMGEFIKVDPASHICYLSNGEIKYDYLVFAAGSTINYFDNENIKKYAIFMKTVNDALNMRNRLLQTLELASNTVDCKERTKLLTVLIAGGGPTGVEVAGMLAEFKKYIRTKDYPELGNEKGDIYLVEGGPKLLAQMAEKSQEEVFKDLVKLGVKIKLNTYVKDFNNDKVFLSNGEIIETTSLIWAAGVIANIFDGIPLSSLGAGKRMLTDEYNKVLGINDIYAIGDICLQKTDPDFSRGHPQLVQVAIQQGANMARNFVAMSRGKVLKPFSYFDKGTMAIIGRNRAVVDLYRSKFHIGGFIALFIWLYIHFISLIGYNNKWKTLYNWFVAYFTRDQSLRMIIRPERNIPFGQTTMTDINFKLNEPANDMVYRGRKS